LLVIARPDSDRWLVISFFDAIVSAAAAATRGKDPKSGEEYMIPGGEEADQIFASMALGNDSLSMAEFDTVSTQAISLLLVVSFCASLLFTDCL
jgi:hypothetical protein